MADRFDYMKRPIINPAFEKMLDEVLQQLETDAESLREKREPFCDRLRGAAQRDESVQEKRTNAARWARHVKELRMLEKWLEDAAVEFNEAALISLDAGGIYSGPDDTIPIVRQVTRFASGVTTELKRNREMARRLAKWYRQGTAEKSRQWGPSTLKVVAAIVRFTQQALGDNNWRRSVKAKQRAEYYAGLLCMQVGLMPHAQLQQQKVIADRIRKRLQRGKPLLQAAEKLGTSERTPLLPASPSSRWISKHRTSAE